ncbi:BTAD domain-containing putative transcriptional regulator [Streptomyces goshikiensis]|uniref:BTAD domain-containing putative transcriptional regulator n=1 Tax=Streptomyces goshikiensis TaxID=1942 RepID=UPI0036781BDE
MRYLILGVTQARDETGAPVSIGGARLRALLVALALRAGGPAAAAVPDLVDEVWGDDPPRDAPAALQALVARLRRALGARDSIRADPAGGYRLAVADRDDVDLHRFTRLARTGARELAAGDPAAATTLRTALGLWRGPALADLPEPARTAHAAAAEAHRATALRDRIEAELRGGGADPAALLHEIETLIRQHPYDERLRAQQLRVLRAAGRPADALDAYDRTRRALAEGLGTDPGPELAALHAELLRPPPPRAPEGNLRPRLTSFVGREPELGSLRADLPRHRLITLTGPGGSGKTRLAEHAAAAHPEPAWLVELARLDHPDAVPDAVLSALGLRETVLVAREKTVPEDPTALLLEHCAHRAPTLLVLDNCEHVIGAAAELAERLLTHCPGIRILATSREPLGVPGESVRPVEPLPPAPAHRLFADRGAAARPGFAPADDPDAVAEICARLDGLPLAIELAAARLRLLTPRQIADRLDDRFRLLTSGSRTVLPRQQTLRAVVDWSWDLLDAPERTVLRRLSVFAGGCDLAAAEAVCADDPGDRHATDALDVADTLGSLVDKSLVLADPTPAGMRYRMLETIHEYAADRAAADPRDRAGTVRRHTAHYLAFAEEAEPLIRSAAQLPWISRVETEYDNLRAALETATGTAPAGPGDAPDPAPTPDPETAQRLAFALGWFWWLRNYRLQGAEWTARVLAVTPEDPPEGSLAYWRFMRLQVLHVFLLAEGRSMEEFRTPEYVELAARIRQAFRHSGPESARFPGMLWPMTGFLTGDPVDLHLHLDEAVENCRRHAGDWELGVALMLRTHVAIDLTGGLPAVEADLAELHEIAHRVGDRWTRAQVASASGEFALSRGQYDAARAEYEECLRLAHEIGAHIEAPFALVRIAEAALCAGDFDTADRFLAEAEREADRFGGVFDVRAYGRLVEALIALFRGDLDRSRTACDLARAEAALVTVPPQLTAGIANVDAVLTAREQGPAAGLALVGPALDVAVTARCAERIVASLAETAAALFAAAGRPADSVRAFTAATVWRAGHPRSVPERTVLRDLPDRNRAALGPDRYTEAEAAGAELTPADVVRLVNGS